MSTKNLKNELQAKTSEISENGKEKKSLLHTINAMKPQIAKALPSAITPERFTRMVMTAVSTNPELGNCSFESFCGAMLQSAQLGLEPNTLAKIVKEHGSNYGEYQMKKTLEMVEPIDTDLSKFKLKGGDK